jgi:tetratricopeptide (TPR) repeat protein
MIKIAIVGLLTLASSALMMAQPKPKTQAEVTALQAMFNATDNDTRIKAGEDVIANFANTEFKSIVLFTIADSYNRKGDNAKMVAYGEQAIEADPKNYQAMLLLAQGIASRVGPDDLDKDKRLAEAEKYANQALAIIPTAGKVNAGLTDDQWAAAKKDYTADAHQALGIIAVGRKKFDVAITEFNTAINDAANPDPATRVRLGQTYNKAGKYDDAIATLDKVMAAPDVSPAIKQFAQAERVRAVTAKSAKK